jgi:C19orf12-like protein/Nin one binding (NOB1) Zn-ribbon like
MILRCRNCGSINTDPGGDPRRYFCGTCGQPQLERIATKSERVLAAGVAGATVGGLTFGPVGALLGGVIGVLFGEREFK